MWLHIPLAIICLFYPADILRVQRNHRPIVPCIKFVFSILVRKGWSSPSLLVSSYYRTHVFELSRRQFDWCQINKPCLYFLVIVCQIISIKQIGVILSVVALFSDLGQEFLFEWIIYADFAKLILIVRILAVANINLFFYGLLMVISKLLKELIFLHLLRYFFHSWGWSASINHFILNF